MRVAQRGRAALDLDLSAVRQRPHRSVGLRRGHHEENVPPPSVASGLHDDPSQQQPDEYPHCHHRERHDVLLHGGMPPDDFRFSVSHVAPWDDARSRDRRELRRAPARMQRPVPAPLKILDGARDRVRRDTDAVQFPRQRRDRRETGLLDEVRAGLCPRRAELGWLCASHSKVPRRSSTHTVLIY